MDSAQILEEFKITEELKEEIFERIIQNLTYQAKPVESPVAIIVGGQCGAGKSGLMSYCHKMFDNRPYLPYDASDDKIDDDWVRDNVIQIEDDEFRAYFPNEREIAINHPNEYIQITNKLTNELTAKIFDYVSRNKYNIIFHQTLKNNRIADDGIVKLKNLGYAVIVRALAVNELESRMSMIERSLGQLEKKGYCRNVTTSDHDNTYNGMPSTLDYIESNGRFDILQVFKRGQKNDEPIMVYSRINQNSNGLGILSTFPYLLSADIDFGYDSAKEALLKTREEEKTKFLSSAEIRIGDAKKQKGNSVISSQIDELEEKIANLHVKS
jgi:hypothetical protein